MHRSELPRDHRPAEIRTVTIACKATGPEASDYWELDERALPRRRHTLADVKAWVEELYRLGAPDNLVLPEADGLTVTVNADTQEPD
jgi:hypothetical protein